MADEREWMVVRTTRARIGGLMCPLDPEHMIWPGEQIGLVRPGPRRVAVGWCCAGCLDELMGPEGDPGPWPDDLQIVGIFRSVKDLRCRRSRSHRIKTGTIIGKAMLVGSTKPWFVCHACLDAAPLDRIAVRGYWTRLTDKYGEAAVIADIEKGEADREAVLVELMKLLD